MRRQLTEVDSLIDSYSSQFDIGKRTLLDLLDTQNARLNAQVQVATSTASVAFADYRILAAMGQLLPSLGLSASGDAEPYARDRHRVPETPDVDDYPRRAPRDWTIEIHDYRTPSK